MRIVWYSFFTLLLCLICLQDKIYIYVFIFNYFKYFLHVFDSVERTFINFILV